MLPLKDSFCRGQKKAIGAAVRKEFHLFVCLALIGFKRQGHLSIGRLDFSLPSRIQLMVRHFWARREYFGKTGEHHGYPGRINPIEGFHTSSSCASSYYGSFFGLPERRCHERASPWLMSC